MQPNERDDPQPREPDDTRWTGRDAWLGVLFAVTGLLVCTYSYLAWRNDVPALFWAPGVLVGPLMLLLGGNALWRSFRTRE